MYQPMSRCSVWLDARSCLQQAALHGDPYAAATRRTCQGKRLTCKVILHAAALQHTSAGLQFNCKQLPHAEPAATHIPACMAICTQMSHIFGQHTKTHLHGDLHAARAHVPLNEGRRVVQPPCECLPHARRQLVRRAVEQLERQAVHHVHGMVQVQGSLQSPLRRWAYLLLGQLPLQPLPLQQGQQLVLALLPLLLARQLLLELLLVGGACSLPCSRHRSHHQVRLEVLLLLVGGPQSLFRRLTNSRRQLLLELWLLGGSYSLT